MSNHVNICSEKNRKKLLKNIEYLDILNKLHQENSELFNITMKETIKTHKKTILKTFRKFVELIPVIKKKVIYKIKDTARLIHYMEGNFTYILLNKNKTKNIFLFFKKFFKLKETDENIKFLLYILKSKNNCKRVFKNYDLYL